MARVVVHLSTGQYANVYTSTREQAFDFIGTWLKRAAENVTKGTTADTMFVQTSGHLPGESDKIAFAAVMSHIISMYVVEDAATPTAASEKLADAQSRIAAALEKSIKDGEEWRGDNEEWP